MRAFIWVMHGSHMWQTWSIKLVNKLLVCLVGFLKLFFVLVVGKWSVIFLVVYYFS